MVNIGRSIGLLPFFLTQLLMTIEAQASQRPYCGMHCLYGAASALGKDVRFEKLIRPEFVTSMRGSTVSDIEAAAECIGLEATGLKWLGRSTLVCAADPLILHVSPVGIHGSYSHWMLFLGMDNGKAVVWDGAGGPTHVSLDHILSRWDGIAIVVSERGGKRGSYSLVEIGFLLLVAAFGVLMVGTANYVSRKIHHSISSLRGYVYCASLLGLAFVSNFAFGIATHTSAQSASQVRSSTLAAVRGDGLTTIGFSQAKEIYESNNSVFVDARYPRDFQMGHIRGARNLPVSSGLGTIRTFASDIPSGTSVVVYCQSEKCKFSNYLAPALIAEGLWPVFIYTGGYKEWQRMAIHPGGRQRRPTR